MKIGAMLHRYWFEFEPKESNARRTLDCRMPWACGVTGHDEVDALRQVEEQFPGGLTTHMIRRRIEDVDVTTLASEVAEKMSPVDFGVPVGRGIWYPHLRNP